MCKRFRHYTSLQSLVDLNAQLAEVLLVPHVLIGLLGLVQSENLLVDDRLDVVRLDGTVHLLELLPASHQDTAHSADVVEALEESWLLLTLGTAEKPMIEITPSKEMALRDWVMVLGPPTSRMCCTPRPPGVSFLASSPQLETSL